MVVVLAVANFKLIVVAVANIPTVLVLFAGRVAVQRTKE
jgi:hypothetical protein